MASLFFSQSPLASDSLITTHSFRRTKTLISKPNKQPLNIIPITTSRTSFSCKATSDHSDQPSPKLDRRDVLLGGLAGGLAAGLGAAKPMASAAPIQAPDVEKCHKPEDLPAGVTAECCPPTPPEIIDYSPPPSRPEKLRVRLPAHELSSEQIAKYECAMALMRALPDDDPRSFKQQADVHCAYCNDAYDQVGFEGKNLYLQVHFCWLFFPFHRWQLYFHERILAKLIGDPDFSLPFWQWDHPAGMKMPPIFANPSSPLYDVNRNPSHLPPKVVDLEYNGTDSDDPPDEKLIESNLCTMYRQMVVPDTPELFMGAAYRAGGAAKPGLGALENTPHNKLHVWGGNPGNPNKEDLGNLYSSGRDPLFYPLHVNCDRLWDVWRTLPGAKRRDFEDPDWLDATFVFYDEEARLVRVKVRDALDARDLGYVYKDVPLPWLDAKPRPFRKGPKNGAQKRPRPLLAPDTAFPGVLEKAVSVEVARPRKKEEEEKEVLVIEGIEFEKTLAVSFEVYVNDEDESEVIGPGNSEFVGTFSNVPRGKDGEKKNEKKEKTKTNISFALSEALKELEAEDDERVVVTLVPKSGVGKVTIGGIKIKLLS